MPIVGTATASVIRRASGSTTPSTTIANAPASATARASATIRCGLRLDPAAGAIAAIGVHRLRLQADMAEHRHAALDQEGDGLGHRRPALELDAGAAGLGHDPGGAAERLRRALLVAAERHIDDHQRLAGAAHDGAHHARPSSPA